MVHNGYGNNPAAQLDAHTEQIASAASAGARPTYELEHLVTFKIKNEAEVHNPKDKMKMLIELDKSGSIWPQKMFMCFNGQWLVMLDKDMKEIENFPGSLITEPTAFFSDDPLETFNNILIFTVPGASLGTTEMHIFQVTHVSAVDLVEDLKLLSSGQIITFDRNKTPIELRKTDNPPHGKDQYGLAVAVTNDRHFPDSVQIERDVQVLNHCFEDIERFIARLQYAAEALRELKSRQTGLLVARSRPPTENEFVDILAKEKLALNYIVKLQNHFNNATEPIHNVFISLQTMVNVCNDVHIGANIAENVVNPLLRRETIAFLTCCLNDKEIEFWQSLGPNWTLPKDQFKDHKGSFHPIYYDNWSPDWVVDEEVPYLAPVIKKVIPQSPKIASNNTWLSRLQSRNVKIALVQYSMVASNNKELHVTKGEYLEILDDSRNWWKARNANGNIGYVPHNILTSHNFEPHNYSGRETDSLTSSVLDLENNAEVRSALSTFVAVPERSSQQHVTAQAKSNMSRSFSVPNVPVPPPLPPPFESQPNTPSGTLSRSPATAPKIADTPPRTETDADVDNASLVVQSEINKELTLTLLQREKRRDLEIKTTPQIYIQQNSTPKEVEAWLRGKGFMDNIVNKLRHLSGEELFALSPHVIEGYFGQKNSRRLISQIVLQKNICEYKTIRSSELSAKLAKARQKVDERSETKDENDIFI